MNSNQPYLSKLEFIRTYFGIYRPNEEAAWDKLQETQAQFRNQLHTAVQFDPHPKPHRCARTKRSLLFKNPS